MKERRGQQTPNLVFNSGLLDVLKGGDAYPEDGNAGDSVVNLVVRAVLSQMVEQEREIILGCFMEGQTVCKMAERLNITPVQANNLKNKALDNFQGLMVAEKSKCLLTPEYNQCVICDCADMEAVDEFIHIWLDVKSGGMRGVLTQLKSKYNINISSLAEVFNHIKYHMNSAAVVEKLEDKVRQPVNDKKPKKKEKEDRSYINVKVSPEKRKEVDQLAYDYGQPSVEVVRQALEVGVPLLRKMYEWNDVMTDASVKLAKMMRKMNPYD